MIQFVNAKINLGLSVVGRRSDGYHLLETCFIPVGRHNGTPENPEQFCDILELTEGEPEPVTCGKEGSEVYDEARVRFIFSGNPTDCPPEKNLIVKATRIFYQYLDQKGESSRREAQESLTLRLKKMIPDGAGLGGGSADASFTLSMLNGHYGSPFSETELEAMAVRLGADCPVFIKNQITFAEGIGEIFSPVESESVKSLAERPYWLAIVKPDLHISTAEAFAGLERGRPRIPLREALRLPVGEWKDAVANDFEQSLFPRHPELARLKAALYESGAIYASMTGSGAALYGIFPSRTAAREAIADIDSPYATVAKL